MLKKNLSYTQTGCIDLCQGLKFKEYYIDKCNCTQVYDIDSEINCMDKDCVRNNWRDLIALDQFKLCADYCPLECKSYQLNINQKFQPIILTDDDKDTKKTSSLNIYSLNVYYDDFKYTYISQSPQIKVFNLISNIGGIFSLFLGLSFVSLIDLFHISFNILKLILKK